jgi:ketol-acid reductoisomerase
VRELYLQNFGTPALVAVHKDASGTAWDRILGIAKANGCTRAGVLETDFREEVESDWFGEQVDLCGGVERLIINAFETLTEAGYSPEIAYFETLHELKLIVDLVQKYGISGMYRRVSETARYGGLTRGRRALDDRVKKSEKAILKEIQDGTFAKEWVDAYEKEGQKAFGKYMDELDAHQVEKVGKKIRALMWPNEPVT